MELLPVITLVVGLLLGLVIGMLIGADNRDGCHDVYGQCEKHPWPDEDAGLDVQNHVGDSRPTRLDRETTYRRWRSFG